MRYRWKSDSLELPDGSVVHAEAEVTYHPATHWDPPESDVGNPDWYLNGTEVEYAVLAFLVADDLLDSLLESDGTTMDEESRDADLD